jgi:hypothetical protein
LFAEGGVVAVKADGGGLRSIGLDKDFGFEGLPFLDAVGDAELLDGDVVAAFDAKRDNIEGNAEIAGIAAMASPIFSLPSERRTRRFWPVSGKAALPRRMAEAMSVRSWPTTALIFWTSTMGLADDSMAASVPKTRTPALSGFSFSLATRLMKFLTPSCCVEGMESERSMRKKTFMPSSGRSHWRPATARMIARRTIMRIAKAVHLRHLATWTSDLSVSHTTHAMAGISSQRKWGCVNWKFIEEAVAPTFLSAGAEAFQPPDARQECLVTCRSGDRRSAG